MQIFVKNISKNISILFIPGFRKKNTDFNITDEGKGINIETTLFKMYNTITIQFSEDDYQKPVPDIADQIYQNIIMNFKKDIVIVAHSFGAFYAIHLAKTYPNIFTKLLLIDPSIKTTSYHEKLQLNANMYGPKDTETYKLKNYDSLPIGVDLKSNIIVRVHVALIIGLSADKIFILNKLTNKNVKSRFIVHPNASHMIHYQHPDVIIDSIKELIKC